MKTKQYLITSILQKKFGDRSFRVRLKIEMTYSKPLQACDSIQQLRNINMLLTKLYCASQFW